MKKTLKVKKSKIHGKGLFATKRIRKGALIGHYDTVESTEEGMHTIWPDNGDKAEDVVCRFKYTNHSDKPNVVYYSDYTVYAIRDIKPGDELTFDYYGHAA